MWRARVAYFFRQIQEPLIAVSFTSVVSVVGAVSAYSVCSACYDWNQRHDRLREEEDRFVDKQAELASTRLIATKTSPVPAHFVHRDAAPALETFLSRKNGMTLVHGPRGAGKSTLIKQSLAETNR
jgi:predicted GTPase